MKIDKFNKIIFILAIIMAILIFNEENSNSTKYITSNDWHTKVWNLDNGSVSKFENGIFYGTSIKHNNTDFGTVSIYQGVMPHNWSNLSIKLKKELTIYKDGEQPLYLTAKVKRVGPIEWYSHGQQQDDKWNNIGLDIMGDVGLDYFNEDITQPRALIIDFYHDTDTVGPIYYQGASSHDNDFRAGIPLVTSRLDIDKEYYFKTRIDGYIKDAMNHYGFENFTIKYIEYYIEAKASNGSVEAYDIALTTT